MAAPETTADPIFVGGTQRSGSSVLGQLIGRHDSYDRLREVQFHANEGGLDDLLRGAVSMESFIDRLEGFWWRRSGKGPDGGKAERGLFTIIEPAPFAAAVLAFRRDFAADRHAAAAQLMKDLLTPGAIANGKATFVETTPTSAQAAPMLVRLFPKCRIVHVVRDGRDVACSLAERGWGAENPFDGLDVWAARLRRADAGMRELAPENGLTIRLEDLVERRRGKVLAQLAEFMGEPDGAPRPMKAFHQRHMSAEAGHLGRWRAELGEGDQKKMTRKYHDALDELRAEGVQAVPLLDGDD